MTRRPWLALVAVLVAAAGSLVWFVLAAERDRPQPVADDRPPTGLTLVVLYLRSGSMGAVVGSTGGRDGALVLPSEVQVTIPGQGDATLGEALALPGRQAATTVANLIGTWIDHYVVLDRRRLASIVDGAGGIEIGGETTSGREVVEMLSAAGDGGASAYALVLSGLLDGEVDWDPSVLSGSDSPADVAAALRAANGAEVTALPSVQAADGVFVAEPDAMREALVTAFGGPDREAVRVIVLNGSGVPGVGELVAERLVPSGFRIVVSENASDFDHDETLVVVGSADDVALAERVRDLLGTGQVNVSVASGIAPVTVVVGKDFTG